MGSGDLRAMPQFIAYTSRPTKPATPPLVRLTLRDSEGMEKRLEFQQDSILIGTIPGCDLQLPGDLTPHLIAVATVVSEGLKIRGLANTESARETILRVHDRWTVGKYHVTLDLLANNTLSEARKGAPSEPSPHLADITAFREQLEKDRLEWEAEAVKEAEKLAVQVRQVQEKEKQLEAERVEFEQQRIAHAEPMPTDLDAVRRELLKLRDSLYQQYRQRRDALVAMREAIRRAAVKIQEQKRDLSRSKSQQDSALAQQRQEQAAFEERQNEIAKQAKLLEEWQRELNNEQRDLAAKNEALTQAHADLETKTREFHADLVRLQRLRESLESKQTDLDQRETLVVEREGINNEERQKVTADRSGLEEQEKLLNAREALQAEKGKELAKHATELLRQKETLQKEILNAQERTHRLALWEQQLGQDRLRLDRLQAEIATQHEQLKLKQQQHQEDESAWKARQKDAEQEMAWLRQETEKYQHLQTQRETIKQAQAAREAEIEKQKQETEERAAALQNRIVRILRLRHRLHQQRQALTYRLQNALETEAANEDLQEQLRCRTVALDQQEAQLNELNSSYQMQSAELQKKELELVDLQQDWQVTLQKDREHLEARRIALDEQAIQLQRDRQTLSAHQEELLKQGQDIERQLQGFVQQREDIKAQSETLLQTKTKLLDSVPQILRSAETALEQLATARSQLRSQLQDIHAYRQRCQMELEANRLEVSKMLKHLDERVQMLSRLQDEQRLEAATLRQDCLSWQAQIELLDMKWRNSHREIEEKMQQNTARSQALEVSHGRLKVQAVALEEQVQDVVYRQSEVNRHLTEMQGWYRYKLRDLAEQKLVSSHHWPQSPIAHPADREEAFEEPDILPLKSDRNGNDQHLADLLSGMGLIDALTLQTLLAEARQQRLTLRDCLLQNEFLTSYQLELIEAGKLESLVLNSLRVIDRLRVGSMETIYRVFDPRLGDEALLRHLSPNVDPQWQEEYRTLFRQASLIRHANVARTLDVLEMAGSPAVVQEWLAGLPGTEWTSQVTETSVALRLIEQAAAGLAAIHEAGLVHGQLQLGRFLLTAQGELKICGAGEPKWLSGLMSVGERSSQDDIVKLSSLVVLWCRSNSRHHSKPGVANFVKRLEEQYFDGAASLKQAVEELIASIERDDGAWQRFLQFIQDRLTIPEAMTPQKKSA